MSLGKIFWECSLVKKMFSGLRSRWIICFS